jgi:LysR family hydrogen peroxide-inducible transcriptional activator
MNIQSLEYALLLRKSGSFSHCARLSGLTQSAISQQIAKLEQEVGILIFNRQSKPIKLTSDGEKFLDRAANAVREIHQLKDFASQLESEIKGELTIGIMPTLAPYITPLFINTLNKKFPDLQLTIKESLTEEIVEGILSGEMNAGLFATPIKTRLKLNYEKLFYERFYAYVSDKHALSKEQKIDLKKVDNADLWLLNNGNCLADQVADICRFKPNQSKQGLTYGTDSIDSLRGIVEHSGGLTFIPELSAMSVPPDCEELVMELKGPKLSREISLVHANGQPKMKLIQLFSKTMKECLPKEMLKKGRKVIVNTGVEI